MSRSPNGKTRETGNWLTYAKGVHMDILTGIVIYFAALVAINWVWSLPTALKKAN